MASFPPLPRYPDDYDNNSTLFLVYNTTEAKISADNLAWSEEIPIVPVAPDKPDIWATESIDDAEEIATNGVAENGFATINGELLYYGGVERNIYGKVNKLTKCMRNIGGKHTTFNKAGTWIRGFVIAEHHNQLVDTVLNIQDFTGFNFDPRQETLDWRIRNLQNLPIIFDDFNCPDVDFTFNIISSTNEQGILIEYSVSITGNVNSFRLDFGDGTFTTSDLVGTHRYALNATIDPVVSASNDQCSMTQTMINRTESQEPQPIVDTVFEIPLPEFEPFPDFNFVPCEIPKVDFTFPPFVFPCITVPPATTTTVASLSATPPAFSSIETETISELRKVMTEIPKTIQASLDKVITEIPRIVTTLSNKVESTKPTSAPVKDLFYNPSETMMRMAGIRDPIITETPRSIPVIFPDKMPQIELVYKGAPIELKINMDNVIATDGKNNCFTLTPCRS